MGSWEYDAVVVGAGPAGLSVALAAAEGGARVLVVEKDDRLGGTLHLSGGHLAAGGTARQRERGIEDSPAAHLEDIRRISRGTAREDLVSIVATHAPDTIEWLAARGFAFAPETPRVVHGHEPYRTARTYYGIDEGASILAVLQEALDRSTVEVWTRAPVTGLVLESDAVVGVEAYRDGAEVEVRAPSVVLATGGYGAEPELFEELEGAPLVSAAARTSTGDGLLLGRSVGAALQGAGTHLPSFGGLPDPVSPMRANWTDRQVLTAERPPVEIYVDRDGRRWVAEDEPSIDAKERALVGIPDQTFWTVFDDAALAAAVGPDALVVGRSPDEVRAMANARPGVHAAQTLRELADLAGISADGLADTVARYNSFVSAQTDPDFGRRHLPAPLATAPFYAIRNHAITLVTFQGLDIDASCAVRSASGSAIPGLYAVGEVIGAGATCGNSFCSGMLLTPALTLGRLLGARLATGNDGGVGG